MPILSHLASVELEVALIEIEPVFACALTSLRAEMGRVLLPVQGRVARVAVNTERATQNTSVMLLGAMALCTDARGFGITACARQGHGQLELV